MIEVDVGKERAISKDGNGGATSSKLISNIRWRSSIESSKYTRWVPTRKDTMSSRYASQSGMVIAITWCKESLELMNESTPDSNVATSDMGDEISMYKSSNYIVRP